MNRPAVEDLDVRQAASPLLVQRGDGVATVILNHPEKGNALSAQLVELLIAAVDDLCAERSVHTLVVRANGPNFCSGFDLSGLEAQTDAELFQRFVRIELLLDAIWRAPIRTVAVANGRAWGAGADLFAACDARLAGPGSTFCFPGASFGLVLGTRRLAERIGVDQARRCTCEGLMLDAAAAHECGLVSALSGADIDGLARMYCVAPLPDRETVASLRAATRSGHEDRDLAALVRSAARPGLKQRMLAYRAQRVSSKPRPS